MAIFTILNCGTMFDRAKQGELIADFGANMQGQEHVDFLITEGPGGSAQGALMPGTFDPFTRDRTAKTGSPTWSQTPMQTLTDVSQGEGKYDPGGHGILKKVTSGSKYAGITGHGWDDNIRHAIATLAEVFPNLNGTVNMVGWSRGAVTCLRIANWMKEFLGGAWTVNIFAVDPVAGIDAGTKLRDTYEVPDIVKDYMGVLAADEARGDFMPQDYSRLQVLDRSKTTVAFLTFPGVHNTVVVEKDSALPEVTSMVRYLAYRFLSDRGTAFKAPENVYSTIRACQVYAQMQKKRASYAALMKKTFVAKQSGGIVQRSTVQLSNSIHPIFVNEHHRLVFKAAFPDIYNWFFTTLVPNPLGKVTTSFRASDPWGQKFQMFYQTDPDSFGLFEDAFTVERRASGGMPAVWTVSAPGVSSAALPVAAQAGLPLVTSLV